MKNLFCTLLASLSLAAAAGPLAEKDLAAIKEHMQWGSAGGEWTWVFFGDSITHGALHTYGWRSFPEVFEERVRFERNKVMDVVINSGNNGDNTGSMLNEHHYERRVARYKPQAVIILMGCNDIVTQPIPNVKANITKFVQRLRSEGIIPILQTYNTIKFIENPTSDYIRRIMVRYHKFDEFNDALREIAAEQDIILVDNYKRWKLYTADPAVMDFWVDDPLHPSARGHLEIANEILRTLGLYEPAGKCSTAVAGGPTPPAVEAAIKKIKTDALAKDPKAAKLLKALDEIDSFNNWKITYNAAAEGLPSPDKWENGGDKYPEGAMKMVVMDGKPALRVDNNMNDEGWAMLYYKDESALDAMHGGILRFDAEVALLPPFEPTANTDFSVDLILPLEGKFGQISIAFGPKGIIGNFPQPGDYRIEPEKFYRVTILVDSDEACGLLRFNDYIAFCPTLNRMGTLKPKYAAFGDGGKAVAGVFALRYLKLGTD